MPRLANSEITELQEVRSQLLTITERNTPVLEEVTAQLQRLLEADRAIVYGLSSADETFSVSFLHATSQQAPTLRIFDQVFRESPVTAATFNPGRPEPSQRNRAIRMDELFRLTGNTTARLRVEGFPKLGLLALDQLRALVCEGDSLLAWVGAFRAEPFTWREQRKLAELIPAFRQRLWLERQLDLSRFALATLDAALSLIPGAAYVMLRSGRVVHANEAGQLRLAADREGTRRRLLECVRRPGPQAPFAIHPLDARGAPRHLIACERTDSAQPRPELAPAIREWRLTPRQTEVLALLLRGYSNKSIAEALQCTLSTAEQHVSAILEKSGANSRAELIVRAMPVR